MAQVNFSCLLTCQNYAGGVLHAYISLVQKWSFYWLGLMGAQGYQRFLFTKPVVGSFACCVCLQGFNLPSFCLPSSFFNFIFSKFLQSSTMECSELEFVLCFFRPEMTLRSWLGVKHQVYISSCCMHAYVCVCFDPNYTKASVSEKPWGDPVRVDWAISISLKI